GRGEGLGARAEPLHGTAPRRTAWGTRGSDRWRRRCTTVRREGDRAPPREPPPDGTPPRLRLRGPGSKSRRRSIGRRLSWRGSVTLPSYRGTAPAPPIASSGAPCRTSRRGPVQRLCPRAQPLTPP